jgi:hypothetical protein
MPNSIEFPFPDDAQLPTIPINLIYGGRSIFADSKIADCAIFEDLESSGKQHR